QAVPDNISSDEIIRRISDLEGVQSIHDLHIWSLDGESHVMTLHVVAIGDDNMNIKSHIITIASEFNITHVTIEFEKPGTVCTTNCD
ncbi:MAG: cation transporter, partial [Bacteroides sp.]